MTEMSEAPDFPGLTQFLFGSPLYAKFKPINLSLFATDLPVDGYCPTCNDRSTFSLSSLRVADGSLSIKCARNNEHQIHFNFLVSSNEIIKIGQYPSLADVTKDETRKFAKIFSSLDRSEFRRAAGLAANGIGIGSFVYLRRIFERLIHSRFDEVKNINGWTDQMFNVRMTDKIELLKEHLPEFLVRNQKIYGILSQGVHELNENQCLASFDLMKGVILYILEEDLAKKQTMLRKTELEKALASFSSENGS